MFAPVPTPAEMAQWDREAAALGVPEDVLMENAAREALAVLRRRYGPLRGARVLVFMGGGNNGGDAACLARRLLDAGALPHVLHTRPLRSYKGAARRHAELARRLGVPFFSSAAPERLRRAWKDPQRADMAPDIIVDGLLGTGFAGPLREKEAALVARINVLAPRSLILALDVPSGLNAATGKAEPDAVRAAVTVTFQAAKPGLVTPGAAPFTGVLEVRPIGMPARVQEDVPASFRLWRPVSVCGAAVVRPDPTDPYVLEPGFMRAVGAGRPAIQSGPAHKGEAGRVVVVGGSEDLSGAPRLAARGALRGGAGLLVAAAPAAAVAAVRGDMPEVTTVSLPRPPEGEGPDAVWSARHVDRLAPALALARAAVVGPGMGRGNGAEYFLEALLELPERPPLVLDADALFALRRKPELLQRLEPRDVLTPHPGEAATLLGMDAEAVQADRFASLDKLAALAPAVWVLKGEGTLAACPGEPTFICPCRAPNLAVGGSGDVLAGLIGALIAQGRSSSLAACLAVQAHALAGLLLARRYPLRGNGPRDIADALPEALVLALAADADAEADDAARSAGSRGHNPFCPESGRRAREQDGGPSC